MHVHGVAAPGEGVALGIGVVEIEHPALGHHGIEVEVALEPLPQLQRPFVERLVAGQHVVRADDGGVAADVAGAEPAFLQHGDPADAVLLGEVIGGRQSVPAAADDDDVVFLLGLGLPPRRLPAPVAGDRRLRAGTARNISFPLPLVGRGRGGGFMRAAGTTPTLGPSPQGGGRIRLDRGRARF